MAGFAPLLLFTGGNFWPPLAVVIAGGVGCCAMLSLLFTPAVYYWIYRRGASTVREDERSPMPHAIQVESVTT